METTTLAALTLKKKRLLAKKISDTIEARNLSLGQFAALMGQQPPNITKWLKGNHNFNIKTLLDIEQKLGVKLIDVDLSEEETMVHFSKEKGEIVMERVDQILQNTKSKSVTQIIAELVSLSKMVKR